MALSVRPSVRLLKRKNIEGPFRFFFKFIVQMCLGVPSINLWLIRSYLIYYAHNNLISDFSIFSIHSVIFKIRAFKFCTFWELNSSIFYHIPICLFFINLLTIHLSISLGTLLARKNIEGTVWSFSNLACRCSWPLDEFIVCLKLPRIKYAHNDLISDLTDFSIFGIQIGIFTDIIFRFITSEATCKFWKLHFLFFIINLKFVSHQVHIWRILMHTLRSSLGLIPVVIDCYTVLTWWQ